MIMDKYKHYLDSFEKAGFTAQQARIMVAVMLDISGIRKFTDEEFEQLQKGPL